jgi:hypothetical protein
MPEHFHLLITEPEGGNPSTVMQVLKQRFARRLLTQWRKRHPRNQSGLWKEALDAGHVWQRRFYDFVVWGPVPQVRAPVLGANLGGEIFSQSPRKPSAHDLWPSILTRSPRSQSPAAHSAGSCSTSTPPGSKPGLALPDSCAGTAA